MSPPTSIRLDKKKKKENINQAEADSPVIAQPQSRNQVNQKQIAHLLFLGQVEENIIINLQSVSLWNTAPHFQITKHLLCFPKHTNTVII